jgi:hypothetical protein
MKPAMNRNKGRTAVGLNGYRWNYSERKVGSQLQLHCPLRWQEGPGYRNLAWETELLIESRGLFRITRETHGYDSLAGRRVYVGPPGKRVVHQSFADLGLHYRYEGQWVPCVSQKGLAEGECRERWRVFKSFEEGTTRIDHFNCRGHEFEQVTVGLPVGFNHAEFHASVMQVVAGCAAQGRFDILADWMTENSPDPIARLFDSPGPLK